CVVVASASQFHARPQPGVMEGTAPAGLVREYRELRMARVEAELGQAAFSRLSPEQADALLADLPEADDRMAAMLVRRDAFNLAASLERLTGTTFARYVFGMGVLGMALSTIILLMLISGFTICEMLGRPHQGVAYRLGCLIPGVGALAPFIWTGKTQFWLAVPTSVFNMTLLPIAYLTFFLMMNNRGLMRAEMPRGRRRAAVNSLMLVALASATYGAAWSIWSNSRWLGVGLVSAFVLLAAGVHVVRPRRKVRTVAEGPVPS
ncbi:MAG TPA: divalent metal cation transporter, partial [Longimicrobiales bacterium]|nr:divalent metal cation transporter [Longimicrobiales bacterium]